MANFTHTSGVHVTFDQAKELVKDYLFERFFVDIDADKIRFEWDEDDEVIVYMPDNDDQGIISWANGLGIDGDDESQSLKFYEGEFADLLIKILSIKHKNPFWFVYTSSNSIHFWWKGDGNPERED